MKASSLKSLALRRPALFMIAATYAWSWLFFFAAFGSWHDIADLRLILFILGAFGPAVGGIITLRLQQGSVDSASIRWGAFAAGATLAVIALYLLRSNYLGVANLQGAGLLDIRDEFSFYWFALYLLPVLVSGWVYSSVQSRKPVVRRHFDGLKPSRLSILLVLPLLLFLPALLIISNLLAALLGMEYELPKYQSEPWTIWLPVMLVKMFTVAIITGGNEEHGWRGVLLPTLQRKVSPLVSSLVIALAWEFWHFPLVLSGIYGEGPALVILIGRLILILPVTLMFTTIYNFSRGSIFLCVAFHACLNSQTSFFTGSSLAIPLAIIIALVLIVSLKMWKPRTAYDPLNEAEVG